jgi:hypothetical protein
MLHLVFLCIALWLVAPVQAGTSIAVLDFELRDLTLDPGIPKEIERTASIKKMLTGELERAGYRMVDIDLKAQHQANAGIGYLFDHADVAAVLGKAADAEYVLVGRLHKPSFLFAYLMGHLVRTRDGQVIGNYIVETKGGDKKLTLKAVESLTVKIDGQLDRRYTPPDPH